MNQFGNQIIFKQLLDRHQRVMIPMIQRDYAQGRDTEKEIREEFLKTIYGALALPPGHKSLPLNLDFIYGSVEGETLTRFLPLDGQQRLTTLFLLHWYLAWKDGSQEDFQKMLCPQGESRFTYGVRPSSTEFFNELVSYFPDLSPSDVKSLKDILTNQPWYFRYWRLDPTIQSSLTMLESIHERFKDSEGFFSRLVDEQYPAITFQLLDLENFGLSGDLYIKMNARGKPLTAFETFKARYEEQLAILFGEELRTLDNKQVVVSDYFSRRIDTKWADFFWGYRDKKTNLYDDAVMNLFRAVVLATRDPDTASYVEDVVMLRNKWIKSTYSTFFGRSFLDRRFSEVLFMLLDAWSGKGGALERQISGTEYLDEHAFFKKIVSDPASLDFSEIILFVAYIVFMYKLAGTTDPEGFKEWMRIIFNLAINTTYNRPEDMKRSIEGVVALAPNSASILEYFANTEKPTTGFSLQQIAEEKLKSELIQADNGWKVLIERAERHGYFKGQIEFLLDFCGVMGKSNTSDVHTWESDAHKLLQNRFEIYLNKASMMFDARGINDVGEYRWERALLSIGDYLLPSGRNKSFLVNSSTDPVSWKRLLRDSNTVGRVFLRQLFDSLSVDAPLEGQLDKTILEATEVEPWQQSLIDTPKAIGYCKNRAVRFFSSSRIYLLKKSQTNGAHVELFTFDLFCNVLERMESESSLSPLKLMPYQEVIGTEVEPHILFSFAHDEGDIHFSVAIFNGLFTLGIEFSNLEGLLDVISVLERLNFSKDDESYFKCVANQSDIKTQLLVLSKALAELPRDGSTYA